MASTPIYNWPTPDNTGLVKNGALDMRTLGNAIDTTMATMTPKSLVDAKGDLVTATANDTPARLAVGANGETLVADSSTSTGLRYQGNFAAGKNKIINGDFGIWQRGTTFNSASSNTYFADRFTCYVGGGTQNITRQTFTPGTAPVAGYEGQYFLRWTSTVAGAVALTQRIENVQTFAGQTATLSFWAKADSAINISTALYQVFGSGGSSAVTNTSGNQAITTSWARYSFTFNLASIAGKTIGTNSNLQVDINLPNSTFVFDTWGWQLEASSVATVFQTATGTIQGELAACQRYYQRFDGATAEPLTANGGSLTTTISQVEVVYPVVMRSAPSSLDVSNFEILNYANNTAYNSGSLAINLSTKTAMQLRYTHGTAVFTAGSVVHFRSGSGTGYIGWSAEL